MTFQAFRRCYAGTTGMQERSLLHAQAPARTSVQVPMGYGVRAFITRSRNELLSALQKLTAVRFNQDLGEYPCMEDQEFREIAHSGGRVTIQVLTREDGQRVYSNGWSHSRPTGAAIFAVHVIQPGIPVGTAVLGGMGSPIDPGPIPGCFMVFVASDSEMMFGQQCPRCNGYWRSRAPSRFCPYCDLHGENHAFLTSAQGAYIQQYSALMAQALDAPDGDHVIDLDAVADAVSSLEKPPFYYSEERQQNKFMCDECGNIADILGRFGYCSLCGTRNDIQELEKKTLAAIRQRIKRSRSGNPILSLAFDLC